jgi:hypothetical protein
VEALITGARVSAEARKRRDLRPWLVWLCALAAVRAAIPLVALAFGGLLPGFPAYSYEGPQGDASGYIATARAIISAGASPLLPVLLVVAVAALLGARWAWRRYPRDRHWVIAAGAAVAFCLLAVVILKIPGQAPSGAIGWPLLLSLPLVPFRVIGWINDDVAVGVGIALAIVANTVTIFATAFIGERVTGSRRTGVAAAALFTFWPFLTWMLLGDRTWANGAWTVDAGLAVYSEPVSTACVAAGIALAVVRGRPPWAPVAAGITLGYAVAVRPTNIVFAAAAAILFAWERDWRSLGRFVVGGLTVVPIVLAFLPKKSGYDLNLARQAGTPLWSNDYLVSTFTTSSVWRPELLVVLLPFVAVGVVASRSRPVALMLLTGAFANAAIYAFFFATWEHPRYLQAGLPALLVLWTAGVAYLVDHVRRARPLTHAGGGRRRARRP